MKAVSFLRSSAFVPLVATLLAAPGVLRADTASADASPRDIPVIAVTDVTKAGRAISPASPEQPVYCMFVDSGPRTLATDFSAPGAWPDEALPTKKAAREAVMAALAVQGYRIADKDHPPTQVLVWAWGLVKPEQEASTTNKSGARPTLRFFGGDKLDLMWEVENRTISGDPRATRHKMGISLKVWNLSAENVFVARVRSLTMESAKSEQKTVLWETRFGCASTGVALDQALPSIVQAAAPSFGRETPKPVSVSTAKPAG